MINVSVIIISKNQVDFLQKTIPALLKQKFSGQFEIIVVDSGSTDGALEYLKAQPVKLVEIRPKIFNYSQAFNTGAAKAKGKFLIRLSGDAIPLNDDFITEMIRPFAELEVGATYGRYVISGQKGLGFPAYWPGRRFPEKITRYSIKPNFLKLIFSPQYSQEITNLAGGCCAVRKSIWEKRPFNERLSAAEDAEYAIFLHLRGYDIVCNPKAVVLHEHTIGFKNLFLASFFSKWPWQFSFEVIKLFSISLLDKK